MSTYLRSERRGYGASVGKGQHLPPPLTNSGNTSSQNYEEQYAGEEHGALRESDVSEDAGTAFSRASFFAENQSNRARKLLEVSHEPVHFTRECRKPSSTAIEAGDGGKNRANPRRTISGHLSQ
jgi:hypothetical protein